MALLSHLTEVGDGGVTLWNREAWHLIMPKDVVVLDFLSHSHRVGDGLSNHIRLQMINEESPISSSVLMYSVPV